MRASHFFTFLLNGLVALLFLLLGILSLALPWAPHFRQAYIDFLSNSALGLILIGLGFVFVALLLLFPLIKNKRRYYYIKSDCNAVIVDKNLIKQSIEAYWKRQFRSDDIDSDIEFKHDNILVSAHLPPYPFEKQKELLKKIEADLSQLLREVLDYRKGLRLAISFANEK